MNLPPELEVLYEDSLQAQERVNQLQAELKDARRVAKEKHITFDNALQEHMGQTNLLALLEET